MQTLYDLTIDLPVHVWRINWPEETRVPVATFLCPSDGLGTGTFLTVEDHVAGIVNRLYRSNYLGFFSGLNDGYQHTYYRARGPDQLQHLFRLNHGRRIRDITDGTSNTMAFAEYLTGTNERNIRGAPFTSRAGSQHLYPTLTPNSSAPDVFWSNEDRICENGTGHPSLNLPCRVAHTNTNYASPRSRHPGGVYVLVCDGSVRFVTDTVDLMSVWRPMATIKGGEIVQSGL